MTNEIVYVLDQNLKKIGLIEDYFSLIWTERYDEAGDFEIDIPITYDLSALINFGNFLMMMNSGTIMVIQDIQPRTSESRSSLNVSGESVESLFRSRVTGAPWHIQGDIENALYGLVAAHVTNPVLSPREITLIKDTFPTPQSYADHHDIFDPGSVYEIIENVCKNNGLGFKLAKDGYQLEFIVYKGVDRSYAQSTNPYVIFSNNFGNVLSSSYYESIKGQVNSVLVLTDDSVSSLQAVWVYENDSTVPEDLDRFEATISTSIDRDIDGGGPDTLTDAEVLEIIETRGRDKIRELNKVGVFEGELDISGNFVYGTHFGMGDILQCKIEDRNIKARVIELIRSYTNEGFRTDVTLNFVL